MPDTEMTKYEIYHEDDTIRRVTVPTKWKVTFEPYPPEARRGRKTTWVISFYEDEEHQRAVHTDVVSFRDMSIEEEVIKPLDFHRTTHRFEVPTMGMSRLRENREEVARGTNDESE